VRLRVLALLAGALVASASIVGVAVASQKASSKLTARVLPKHINPTSIKKASYKWTVRGTLTYGRYCPNGASNQPYCETLSKAKACTGKVTWYTKIGKSTLVSDANKKIGSGTTTIKSNCTYSFSHKFPTSDFVASHALHDASSQRHVGVFFYVTYKGNTFLLGSSARRQEVIAKVLEQS
jgi:hypothetical protein